MDGRREGWMEGWKEGRRDEGLLETPMKQRWQKEALAFNMNCDWLGSFLLSTDRQTGGGEGVEDEMERKGGKEMRGGKETGREMGGN